MQFEPSGLYKISWTRYDPGDEYKCDGLGSKLLLFPDKGSSKSHSQLIPFWGDDVLLKYFIPPSGESIQTPLLLKSAIGLQKTFVFLVNVSQHPNVLVKVRKISYSDEILVESQSDSSVSQKFVES